MYNNQYVKMSNQGEDEQYIENLFQQIKVMERKIASKNREIKELERFLVIPEKDKKAKKKKRTSSLNLIKH